MEMRSLGRSGLKVSVVGLGCMNFGMMNDQAQASDIVQLNVMGAGIQF